MRFYGMLFGCSERADSLFSQVKTDYETLAKKIKNCRERKPSVICDRQTGATWYQPGGASTMGQMLADAGAQYVWADRKEAGSLPLDMESVFASGRNADIWLIKYGADSPSPTTTSPTTTRATATSARGKSATSGPATRYLRPSTKRRPSTPNDCCKTSRTFSIPPSCPLRNGTPTTSLWRAVSCNKSLAPKFFPRFPAVFINNINFASKTLLLADIQSRPDNT